jgi:hypothetical protein
VSAPPPDQKGGRSIDDRGALWGALNAACSWFARCVNRHYAKRQPLVADIDETLGPDFIRKLRRAGKGGHARQQILVGRRIAARGRAMGYHRSKPHQQLTAGRTYLCRAVRGAGSNTHHFGSPPDTARSLPI